MDLVDILKDIIIYRNTSDSSILFVLSQYYLDMIVPYISCDEAFAFIDVLMDASEKYAKVINPAIYFELALLKMCNQVQSKNGELIDKVDIPQTESIQYVNETQEVNTEAMGEVIEMDKPILQSQNNSNQVIYEDIDEQIGEPLIEEELILEESQDIIQEDIPTFEFEKQEDVEQSIDNDIKVDRADIMNILVQARREILESIQERWPIIKRYLANLNTAKSAGMLCDGTAVAACPGGFIIAFEFQPAVNAVNYYKNYKQLSSFLTEILGQEYRFVAIQQDEWIQMRSQFIDLKKRGQLPEPHNLTLKHIDSHDLDHVDLNEAQEFAVKLFGDIVEFKED